MGTEDVLMQRVQGRFPSEFRDLLIARPGVIKGVIDRQDLMKVATALRDEMGFEHLSCITAVDWKDHFECVYHIYDYDSAVTFQVNALIPYDDPKVDSLVKLWNAANYHEREAWDLMGIEFVGHPKLDRILLPKDFRYHPLRKDFPQETERQYISRRKLKTGGR